jgi:competence protein ComFC
MFRPAGAVPSGRRSCGSCESSSPVEPRRIESPLRYEGAARDVVLAAKVGGQRQALRLLADELADAIRSDTSLPGAFDLVTWAPTTDRRQRRRGFDQSEAIARLLARRLGIPCRRLLRRLPGPPQTGSTRSERLVGPRFRARPARSHRHGTTLRVLVIDDVITTGSTLRAAAHALTVSGWRNVVVAACAATPEPSRRMLAQFNPVSDRTASMADD